MEPVVRNELELLLAQRGRPWWRLRFPQPLETLYRDTLRRQLRWIRTALLFSIGLGFALSPLHEQAVFQAPAQLAGSMELFAWAITPIAWTAALLTWFSGPRELTKGFQSTTIIATLLSVLALRWMALISSFQYPPGMLGITALAIAVFGGFAWYRVLAAFSVFFTLAITQEFVYGDPASDGEPFRSTYVYVFSYLIAVLSSLSNEVLRRQNWMQHSLATALSRTDMLTGLSNRADFERRFEITLDQARRDRTNLAVMLLDVDHFKRINDRRGHATGDQALRAVADAIAGSSAHRPLDIRARTGGEEFVVVWYDAPAEAVPRLVAKVMDAVRAIRLEAQWLGEPLRLTVSAGVCWGVPGENATGQEYVRRADELMYQAKSQGRDRVCSEPLNG